MQPAYVLGKIGEAGRINSGHRIDVLVLDAPGGRHLAYHLGGSRFVTRLKSGRVVPVG